MRLSERHHKHLPFLTLLLLALLAPACIVGSDGPGDPKGDPDRTDPRTLELLDSLRADLGAAMRAQSAAEGWPAPVEGGYLFVSTDANLDLVAGDHDGWQGTAMHADQGFRWVVLDVGPGNRYKFTNRSDWVADPWSRAYEWDGFGEMSMVAPAAAHLERYFGLGAGGLSERTVRVWVPGEPATHVLYVQDGQNLFNPNALWGGWRLQESAPPGMLLVGIDNTPQRMDEYTHVTDVIGGETLGGLGDQYADFVQTQVRPLITAHYGEPGRVGVMGSSLGGLISFHIADRYPGEYDFAASLSGTMGWGSIGDNVHNDTMLHRYQAAGHRSTVLYLDSGGNGTCYDSDGDGLMDDDPDARDNYCENNQLRDLLDGIGYTHGVDLWHWWEPDAPHNEAAWAERVGRPLDLFAGMP